MEEENKKKFNFKIDKKKLIIIIIAIILLISIVFTLKAIRGKRTVTEELGNISNMGLAGSGNDMIFYNKYEEGIVKVKGSEESQITNETAYSINVVGDEIYYLSVGASSDINIMKVKSNGSGLTVIKTIKTSISKIYVADGFIYYATNEKEDGIAKLTIDGTKETIITQSEIKDFEVVDGIIYYTNNIGDLYRMTTNGTELTEIETEYNIKEFQVKNEWIYYFDTDKKCLCKVTLTGENPTVVSEAITSEIYNVTKDKIYFFDSENKVIASVNLAGGNYKEIVSIKTNKTKINVVGDYIYYLDAGERVGKVYQMYRVKTNGASAKAIEY